MDKLSKKAFPHCRCVLRADRYVRHLAMQHGPAAEEKKALLRARLNEGNQLVTCSICNASLKARNLDRHNDRLHSGIAPRQHQKKTKTKLIRAACTCGGENENCFKCFGTGFYDKEILVTPPFDSSNTRSSSAKKPSGLGSFASDSRGHNYSIREGGRFSSFPLHDDFGDESSS